MKLLNENRYTFSRMMKLGHSEGTVKKYLYGAGAKLAGAKKEKVLIAKTITYLPVKGYKKYLEHLLPNAKKDIK